MFVRTVQLRWLFWLRWTLFIRRYTQGPGRVARIVSMVISIFAMTMLGVLIAIGGFILFRFLPASASSEILFLLLAGVYLLWILLPIMGFNTNEGLNISKLGLFPLSRFELMLSLIISTLLDVPTILLFFILGMVVASWSFSVPLALFALLTMLVFYVQLIAISQLVLAMLMRFLQSRRFRDIAVLLTALISLSGYLCRFGLLGRNLGAGFSLDSFTHEPFSPYLQWFPPGMAARALQQAALGQWGWSFAWLGGLIVVSFLVLYLWQSIVERGLVAAESGGSAAVRRRRRSSTTVIADAARPTWQLLPDQVLAVLLKDIKYYWREPQLKVRVARSFISIFILAFFFLGSGNGSFLGYWRMLYLPFLVLFSISSFSHNTFGYERANLATLFLFPIDTRRLLWGKNLFVLALGCIELIFADLAFATISQSWNFALPAFIIGLAGLGVALGFGNITSVFFPFPVVLDPRNMRRSGNSPNMSSNQGCMVALRRVGLTLVELFFLLPVLVAILLPILFNVQWVWLLTMPASLAYGVIMYIVLTQWAAPQVLMRAPEILEKVTRVTG